MSIEAILEKAYKAVTVANQPELAEVAWQLAHATTDPKTSVPVNEIEKLGLPSITLTATANQEMIPNSGVFQVTLEIMCEDAAVRTDGPAIRLDGVFRYATRPLLYKPLVGLLTAAANGEEAFKCYGLPERTENHGVTFGEATMMQGATALFICSTEITPEDMSLPSWTYTPNAIGSGLFVTDNSAIAGTAQITLSQSVLGNYGQGWNIVQVDNMIVLADSAGNCSRFQITSISNSSGDIQFGVAFRSSSGANWSGRYSLSFIPASV